MSDDHGPVPDDLTQLVDFLNTLDLETGFDELNDRRFLRWSPGDREIARELRTGLRAAALANGGPSVDSNALGLGTNALAQLPIDLRIAPAGSPLIAGGTGAKRYLARVAVEYLAAAQRGRWARVKLCASPDCRWAFWDSSRNGSRRWCAMSACGARSKMRRYRTRLARP